MQNCDQTSGMVGRQPHDNNRDIPFDVRSRRFLPRHSNQIWLGSVTRCLRVCLQVWTYNFLFFVHNLLDNRTSYIATKFEEQQILLMQQKLFGSIFSKLPSDWTRVWCAYDVTFAHVKGQSCFQSGVESSRSYCDTDDVRLNKVWYAFYKSII